VSTVRQYRHADVTVQVSGIEGGGRVKFHVEHKSGAALIVPECEQKAGKQGPELETRGFDGTDYKMIFDEVHNTLKIIATASTSILGDQRELELLRAEDLMLSPSSPLRVTGDEPTMPISVKR
jgi:hypothetical protein